MKAMVLAAGIGSRLRPLTDTTPKALIEVGGVPMLELVLRKLRLAGVDSVVINVHHLAEKVEAFLKAKENLGLRVELSREAELLDTGGGLKKAARFFDDGKPFFLYNVDVLCDIHLPTMMRAHVEKKALATLAVQARASSRYLLFDRDGRLCGREAAAEGTTQWAGKPVDKFERLGFGGIHVVSPELLPKMTETGVFSINKTYLRLAGQGERIQAFRFDDRYWGDIGSMAKLEEVRRQAVARGLV